MLKKKIGSNMRLQFVLLTFCILLITGCSSLKGDGAGSPSKAGGAYQDAVPRVDPLMSGPNKPYTVRGKRYVPDTREVAYRKKGVASWYGAKFHGRQTSSGEIYDMHQMTAAHKTLPIPSYVHVTNVKNRRSIIVRVNDRGPFSDNRIIDLSYAAAFRLGFVDDGITEVIVERIMPADIRAGKIPPTTANPKGGAVAAPTPMPNTASDSLSGGFFIQVGAYQLQENASKMQSMISTQNQELASKMLLKHEGGIYRVYVGPYATEDQAQQVGNQIESRHAVRTLLLDRR